MKVRQGQAFLPDFLFSAAIFAVIAAVFLFSWNTIISNQQPSRADAMRESAIYTTTFLVSTSGYPEDWNASTVEIPGFATDDNFLQSGRIEEFSKISYSRQKNLLKADKFLLEFRDDGSVINGESRIGDEPVAYMVESSSDFTDVKLLETLNSSSITWDLYWPSGSNEAQLDSLTARNVYNYTENGPEMMQDIVENSSSYPTVIAEDVNIDYSELDNTAELRSYVEDGGSFVHTESDPNLITNTFNLNKSGDATATATVEKVSPLLNSSYSVGDTVEFDDSNAAYDTPGTVYANGTSSGAGCAACEWNIGAGKLFYLSDTFSDNSNIGLAFENADNSIGLSYRMGRYPGENARTVIPVSRDVLLNTSGGVRDVEMRFIVWE